MPRDAPDNDNSEERGLQMLPRVIIYNEVSIDGRMQWLPALPEAPFQYYELSFRSTVDAILMGSVTAFAPDAQEAEDAAGEEAKPPQHGPPPGWTIPLYEPRPLLVVPDSRGRVHNWRHLQAEPWWRDHIALCSHATPPSYLAYLRKRQVAFIIAGDDHVDYRLAFEQLHERYGVRTLRTDCGGTLNGVLLRAGLVDEISVLVNPSLVGGRTGAALPFVDAPDPASRDDVLRLHLLAVERVKGDVLWLRYRVVRPA